jgi:hypothetical protein
MRVPRFGAPTTERRLVQLQWLSHQKISRTLLRSRDTTRQFRNAMCNFVSEAARDRESHRRLVDTRGRIGVT